LNPRDLDAAYRDLQGSVRRCRTFLDETSPCYDVADDLVNACSLLEHIYRMRFHSLMADLGSGLLARRLRRTSSF
jgi:hypothetical protein